MLEGKRVLQVYVKGRLRVFQNSPPDIPGFFCCLTLPSPATPPAPPYTCRLYTSRRV